MNLTQDIDCVKAEPFLDQAVAHLNGTLLKVPVGDRPTWRDSSNYYRTNPSLLLTNVPTLIAWGKVFPIKNLK